ncbi:MAG: PcfJ domain-containing protein [Hyphomonadaceae bacterium]|jgi:hypothetical protein|nr:PcfJ domain-containing protein [Hyphomonadaceae bacterium]
MTAVTSVAAPAKEDAAERRRRRIEAFHPHYRRLVADLTCCAPALEDLADTFPALLFALATGYATPPQRERTFALVNTGAPLREAADALGVAWWLRKLPPHAFAAPLPALSTDPDFGFRITGLVPPDTRLAPIWLTRVAHAHAACSQRYALWLARQDDLIAPPEEFFMSMAAWAWFSEHEGHLGHRLLRKPWHPDMSFKRAREELGVWRQRLQLIECLGSGIEMPWLSDGMAVGYSFVALRTVDDFVAESEALDNCLDQYADQLRMGATAIFSIRKNARSVACVEIGLHETEATMPTIVQLRAARNRRAPPDVWQATFAWLGGQRLEPLVPARHAPKPAKRTEAQRQLWGPYLAFLAGTPHEQLFRHVVVIPVAARRTRGGRRGPERRTAELPLRMRALGERVGASVVETAVAGRDRP